MRPDQLTDEQILYMVGTTDAKLCQAGLSVRRREFEVPRVLMEQFGFRSYILTGEHAPPLLTRIRDAFKSIYRPQDLAIGGHIGVFMYRDIFARISVPIIYGKVRVEALNHVELTPVQKRMIGTEPKELKTYWDQFCDVGDIQYGVSELRPPFSSNDLVKRYLDRARLHLHASAAILTGGYDFRGAVQSSLLATELALKGAGAANGQNESELRSRFGHNRAALARFVGERWAKFDAARVLRAIERQPNYVDNRYAADEPDRRDVGHIAMGAQYIVAEVVRQMSDRDFRASGTPPLERQYPL